MSEIVTLILFLVALVFVGLAYSVNCTRSKWSGGFLFSPIPFILINYALIFVYRPFIVLYYDAPTLNFEEINYEKASLAIQFGLLSLCAAMLPYVVPFDIKSSFRRSPRLVSININHKRLLLLNLFFSIIIIGGLLIYGSALNNTGDRMENPSEYKAFFVFILMQRFHFIVSVLAFYVYITSKEWHVWRLPLLFLISIAPILSLLAAGRGATFYLVIAYGIIYVFVRSVRISWKHVVYIGILGVLFSALNFLLSTIRVVISSTGWEWSDVMNAIYFTDSTKKLEDLFILASWDYSVFDVLVTILNHLDSYTFGVTNLQYFLSYVPRLFWPDKPLDQGFMLYITSRFYGDVFSQTGSTFAGTIVGEGYLNFGIIGIIIYSFIFSLIIFYFYRRACRGVDSNSIIVYAIIFPISQQVIRGGLDIIVNFALMILVPLWLINLALRNSSQRPPDTFQTHTSSQ
jgi:oligosaccharide repeat unit polymerase